MTASNSEVRIERDSMGPMEVPTDALYGASTMRAVLNFPISDLRFPRTFIRALGLIKLAAARTNNALGNLDEPIMNAIVAAAQEAADGNLDEHLFPGIEPIGVPKDLAGTAIPFPYGDLDGLAERLERHRGEVAAVMMSKIDTAKAYEKKDAAARSTGRL